MKSKITLLLLSFFLFSGNMYSQFDSQHPDLRLCGTAPNYYLDVFNCTSNNFTLNNVFLSLTNVNGQPLSNTTCTIGASQQVYVLLNYTSNANNTPNNARLFADLSIDNMVVPINSYLGNIAPGAGQRQIYGPFMWTCGQELVLSRILVVWRTGGAVAQLSSYNCATYTTSQCELPGNTVISKPLAVQFMYKACRVGNNTTVTFTSTTNGGIGPYAFAWDFDNNGTTDSTLANPVHTYTLLPATARLTVTDSQGLVNTFTQVITSPTQLSASSSVVNVSCSGGSSGSIDLSAAGGTPNYTYLWSNGATTQDITGLSPGTYTVTVKDANNCQTTHQAIISGGDAAAPVVTAPANVTLQGCNSSTVALAGLFPFSASQTTITAAQFAQMGGTYTDASAIATITYQDVQTGSCPKIITRTIRVTDVCNNVGIAVQTITIQDTTAPVFEPFPPTYSVNCPDTPVFDAAKAIDNCDNFPVLTYVDTTTSGACVGSYSITRIWTATDACGNASTLSQTINVTDVTAPVIAALPAPSTISCPAVPAFAIATAIDACGSAFTLTSQDVTTQGTCAGSYTVIRTWTATDGCGNVATASQTIAVQDNTAPIITVSAANLSVECDGQGNTGSLNTWLANNGGAAASDSCSTVTWTNNFTSISNNCSDSATVTFTATDACGNAISTTATFTVQDTTAPVLPVAPATANVACATNVPTMISLTATDTCSPPITVQGIDVTTLGSCPNSFVIIRTWTFTDTCGNSASVFQTINVNDNIAPTAPQSPASITVACAANVPPAMVLTANDNCGDVITGVTTDNLVAGSCANAFVITRTWTFTDACGNASSVSQTINVNDNIAPIISVLPAASTINCTATPNFAVATASDNCAGTVALAFNDVTTNGACAGSYTIVRTWIATDVCGNSSTTSQTINVQDVAAPVIAALPTTTTINCPTIPQFATATATDACSAFTLTFNDVTTQGSCAGTYSVTRTWTATDGCGNISTATQTINVQDVTAPVVTVSASNTTVECNGQGNTDSLSAWLANNGGAIASDSCSTVTWTNNFSTLSADCSTSVTVIFTATDVCGNWVTTTATFTVVDTTAPVVPQAPASITVSCAENVPAMISLTATDLCSGSITSAGIDVITPGSCPNSFTILRTWTFTDACGNAASVSQTININDTVAPVISSLPTASTINCPALPNFAVATATDNCSGLVNLSFNDATISGTCAGSYSIVRTWTATDACGNTSTASQTINVQDITAPVISELPAPSTIDCPAVPVFATPTATDACASAFTLTSEDVTVQGNCAGTYSVTRTWTATDACGNISTASQTINVQDITAPVITTQASNITVECDASGNGDAIAAWLAVNGNAAASDTCSEVTWTNNFSTISADCSTAVTVTFTATDACGNAATTTATFTVNDTVVPVAPEAPADVTVACALDLPAMISLTATDNCSAPITVQGVDVVTPGTCANAFTVIRTWTFTDACANTSSVSQTITVSDNLDPVISELPAPSTINCPATPEFATPTATDNCAGEVALIFNDVNTQGNCAGSYTVVRTWTATDACGNTATASQTINVQDITAPAISELPAPSTIDCPATPEFATPTATDACGSTFTLDFADATTSGICAGSYSIVRTWTATDACGNTSTASQTINVQDITAPVISELPAPSTIDCPAVPVFATPTATDACASAFTLTSEDVTVQGNCAGTYSVTRTWTATDACGNISTASQTINVQDITAPVITTQASNITVECDASGNGDAIAAWLAVNGNAAASDTCSEVTWTNNFSTISADCSTAVTVTFTATDACGNAATTTATFTVNDTVVPVAPEAPADVTVACALDLPAMISLTATDNCSAPITVQGVDVVTPGTCANAFTVIRTWTFTDACANTSSVSQTITVSDNLDPVISELPAPSTINCPATPEFATPTATDNCAGEVALIFNDVNTQGNCAGSYTVVRTWTATDACGNTATASQTINVQDITPPVIVNAATAVTIECAPNGNDSAYQEWLNSNGGATATDDCSEVTWTYQESAATDTCLNVTTVIFTATDACGNIATTQSTFTIQDTTPPTFEPLTDSTVDCPATLPLQFSTPVVNDICNTYTVTFVDVNNTVACPLTSSTTRTWTATDACGNSATASQTINVQDITPPTIQIAAENITIECGPGSAAALQAWLANNGSATASDTCSEVTWTNNYTATTSDCTTSNVVTFTATDACGNTVTTQAAFIINDTTAPVISPLTDMTLDCPVALPLPFDQPTVVDECSIYTLTFVDVANTVVCPLVSSVTRTWTATDACGNASTISQTINVQDITAPVITVQASNITLECDGTGNSGELEKWLQNHGNATATDTCSDVTWTNSLTSTTVDCVTTNTVVFTASDSCGNTATTTATFIIQDTTAPVVPTAPIALEVQCATDVPQNVSLTAVDACYGDVTAIGQDVITPGNCINSYTIIRTWSFVDACKNTSTVSQTINVNDTTAPTFVEPAPADVAVNCGDVPTAAVLTAIDNCPNAPATVTMTETNVVNGCTNVVTRIWTATDACLNTTTITQTITVSDTTPPTFVEALPANETYECGTTIPAAVVLTATDNCDTAPVVVTFSEVTTAGQCLGSQTVTRTWTAADACGNPLSYTQTITIQDTVAPVIMTVAVDQTIECDGTDPTNTIQAWLDANGGAVAVETCSTVTWTNDYATLTPNCDAGTIVTFTATDACGNATSTSAMLTIHDTTAPIADVKLPPVVDVPCGETIPTVPDVTFSDACSTVGAPVFTEVISPIVNNQYTIVWTWIATDACGNESALVTQTVNVTTASTDVINNAPITICENDPFDLNDALPEGTPTDGIWTAIAVTPDSLPLSQVTLTGSLFSPANIPVTLNQDITVSFVYQLDGICPINLNVPVAFCSVNPCDNIIIHNAFSPNNDGINEFFSIEFIEQECHGTNHVEIFNRWGVQVYEVDNYNNGDRAFKGVSEGRATVDKGAELPTGTYFYLLQYNTPEGTVVKKDGYLYLSR